MPAIRDPRGRPLYPAEPRRRTRDSLILVLAFGSIPAGVLIGLAYVIFVP